MHVLLDVYVANNDQQCAVACSKASSHEDLHEVTSISSCTDRNSQSVVPSICFSCVFRRRRGCSISKRKITCAGASVTTKECENQFNDNAKSQLTQRIGNSLRKLYTVAKLTLTLLTKLLEETSAPRHFEVRILSWLRTLRFQVVELHQQTLPLLQRRHCSCHKLWAKKALLHRNSLRVQAL